MIFTGNKIARICTSSSLFLQPPPCGAWRLAPSSGCCRYLSCTGNNNSRRFPGAAAAVQTRPWLGAGGGIVAAPSSRRATALSMGPIHGSASVGDKTENIRALLRQRHDHPADGLQVIMDFDLTMTAPGSEQCHHMFETSSALPLELRSRLAPFFTGEIKLATRDAWWDGYHAVLIEEGITEAQVAAVAAGADLTLRAGTAELMLLLEERGVPLLVVSAGITDIVVETLRGHGLLLDNVTVRANTMLFGQDGKLQQFRESSPVHSRNKDQTAERERNYFASHGHRRCVVVVGDKPGDADVTIGFAPDERCLKIGFFDHSHEHPHPDLPPLPPPPPPPAVGVRTPDAEAATAANNGGTTRRNGDDDSRRIIPEGFGFLRENNGSSSWMLLERTTAATAAAAAAPAGASAADSRNSGAVAVAAGGGDAAAAKGSGEAFLPSSSEDEKRIQGRPGSQGGGERADDLQGLGEGGHQPDTAVAAEEMLRAYGDRFDVVACGGHSMDLVADFVRHFVGASSPDGLAAERRRGGKSDSPPRR